MDLKRKKTDTYQKERKKKKTNTKTKEKVVNKRNIRMNNTHRPYHKLGLKSWVPED